MRYDGQVQGKVGQRQAIKHVGKQGQRGRCTGMGVTMQGVKGKTGAWCMFDNSAGGDDGGTTDRGIFFGEAGKERVECSIHAWTRTRTKRCKQC